MTLQPFLEKLSMKQVSQVVNWNGESFIVRVSKPGRVIIQLFNKKHRQIGEASLEVKQKGQSSLPPTLKG